MSRYQGSRALGKRKARSPNAMTTLVRLAGQPSRSSAVNSSGRYCGHGDEDDDKDYQEGVSRAMCGEAGRVAGGDEDSSRRRVLRDASQE